MQKNPLTFEERVALFGDAPPQLSDLPYIQGYHPLCVAALLDASERWFQRKQDKERES